MESTLVLGLGNLLLSDEGVGIHVARRLKSLPLPPHIEVLDGGTGGYELLGHLAGRSRVIIVDCISTDAPPGTMIRATANDLDLRWPEAWSAHHGGLRELLYGIGTLSPPPEIIVLGVVPDTIDEPRIGLSPALHSKFDAIVKATLEVACAR